jgi:hypothetical protein
MSENQAYISKIKKLIRENERLRKELIHIKHKAQQTLFEPLSMQAFDLVGPTEEPPTKVVKVEAKVRFHQRVPMREKAPVFNEDEYYNTRFY